MPELSTLGAPIKTAYEAESDTNAFTDAEKAKLAAIEAGATADLSAAEILAALLTVDGPGSGLDADAFGSNAVSAFAPAGHVHDAVDTNNGTFADARIAESNVTQHKAAILASPTLTGTVTVPDGALAIADTSGLQTALDGKQPVDAELTAVAGLVSAADRLPYFTGSGAASLATFTSAARNLVDDTTTAAMLTTLGAAPSTPVAPVMVTGDLTLVSATHHGKTLEINAATSKRITCAQIGAGVRCRIHRPAIQPSPILLPPATTAVWLGGADMGFNRIRADGFATVEYSNANVPKLSGDLEWGGRPTNAVFSLDDNTNLRRGEGVSPGTVDAAASSWTSGGVATEVYSHASVGEQPIYQDDGTLLFDSQTAKSQLVSTDAGPWSGDVVALSMALQFQVSTVLSSRMFQITGTGVSGDSFQILNSSSGNMRLNCGVTAGSHNIDMSFTQTQWLAFVFILSIAQEKCWIYSNSRVSGNQRKIVGSLSNIPDWAAWGAGTDWILGNNFATHTCSWKVAHFSFIQDLDAALSGADIDDDVGIRLLGEARAMMPEGADG